MRTSVRSCPLRCARGNCENRRISAPAELDYHASNTPEACEGPASPPTADAAGPSPAQADAVGAHCSSLTPTPAPIPFTKADSSDLRGDIALFREHATKSRRLSSLTVSAYKADLTAFAVWREREGLSLQVDKVSPAEIEAYLADCPEVSPATLRRRLDAISSLYKFLIKRGLATANPVAQVDRPRLPDNRRAHVTEEQMARLSAVVQGTDEQAIFLLLGLLGLRRSEVVSLSCGDVDLNDGRLQILQSKGGHSRTLPIPDELAPALETQFAARSAGAHEPLFVSQTRQRLSRSVLARLFSRWLADAGLEGRASPPTPVATGQLRDGCGRASPSSKSSSSPAIGMSERPGSTAMPRSRTSPPRCPRSCAPSASNRIRPRPAPHPANGAKSSGN